MKVSESFSNTLLMLSKILRFNSSVIEGIGSIFCSGNSLTVISFSPWLLRWPCRGSSWGASVGALGGVQGWSRAPKPEHGDLRRDNGVRHRQALLTNRYRHYEDFSVDSN